MVHTLWRESPFLLFGYFKSESMSFLRWQCWFCLFCFFTSGACRGGWWQHSRFLRLPDQSRWLNDCGSCFSWGTASLAQRPRQRGKSVCFCVFLMNKMHVLWFKINSLLQYSLHRETGDLGLWYQVILMQFRTLAGTLRASSSLAWAQTRPPDFSLHGGNKTPNR